MGTGAPSCEIQSNCSKCCGKNSVALFQKKKRGGADSLLPVVSEAEIKSDLRCQKILIDLRMLIQPFFFPPFKINVLVFFEWVCLEYQKLQKLW